MKILIGIFCDSVRESPSKTSSKFRGCNVQHKVVFLGGCGGVYLHPGARFQINMLKIRFLKKKKKSLFIETKRPGQLGIALEGRRCTDVIDKDGNTSVLLPNPR